MNKIKACFARVFASRKPASSLRGDLAGGITSALMGISGSMAYGMIAFAPLGPKYVPMGIAAGLIGLAFANIGAAVLGSNPIMITSPGSLCAVMMASALTAIMNKLGGQAAPDAATLAIAFMFFVVFASGLLQVLLGALKLGGIAKYIPYPVVAGLLNGVAVIVIISQIKPMLGLSGTISLLDFSAAIDNMQLLTLLIGVATVLAIRYGKKITKKIQPLFLGLGIGTALYYLIVLLGGRQYLSGTVGTVPGADLTENYASEFWNLITTSQLADNMVLLGPMLAGLTFAISLKTMVVSVSTDNLSQSRSDTNRELIGQGVGNMLSGVFGGLASTGNQSRSTANYQAGGRTSISKLVSGLAILALLFCLGPIIALLPKIVLAGVLVAVAIKMVDSWSLALFSSFSQDSSSRKHIIADITIVLTVMTCMVAFGIFQSIAVGILISLGSFIYRMTARTVRRDYTASHVRSSVDRCEHEIKLLEEHGAKIHVYELEGAIFFGTADKLAGMIDPDTLKEADCVILDFKRISDIDSTGTNILVQLKNKYDRLDKSLVISGIDLKKSYSEFFSISGTQDAIGKDGLFSDTDDALAWAEDRLLDKLIAPDRYQHELALTEVEILSQLTKEEAEILGKCCRKTVYGNGDVIFNEGDPGDSIMVVLQGRVDIYIDFEDPDQRHRVATLRPGTVLGEIAVLDKKSRSATAVANGQVTNEILPTARLRQLQEEHPDIASKFLIGVGRELAKRVRTMDAIITELRG